MCSKTVRTWIQSITLFRVFQRLIHDDNQLAEAGDRHWVRQTVNRNFPLIAPSVSGVASSSASSSSNADTLIVACSRVRLLGVDISSDLSLDHHVSRICTGCYYRLRQLRRIRRSLDSDSLVTLVTPLCIHGLTTATLFLLVHQGQ